MKQIVPNYYAQFRCIAGDCRHSCCIGWEIDIDEQSLRRYRAVGGELGRKLRRSIDRTEDGACFRLEGAQERCPFLNERGLCELILQLGEDTLCQICTDHPRFRSFFADRTETGLGLCCEAAGRLILGQTEPTTLVALSDDGAEETPDAQEQRLLALRGELTALMQNRSLPLEARMQALFTRMEADAPDVRGWVPFLLELERLDDRWAQALEALPQEALCLRDFPGLEIPMEQLMVYLLYRHLPGALEDGDARGRALLCGLLGSVAAQLCMARAAANGGVHLEDAVDVCRMLSSEIEYSQENVNALLAQLHARPDAPHSRA